MGINKLALSEKRNGLIRSVILLGGMKLYLCRGFSFDCPVFCSMNVVTNIQSLNVLCFFCSSQVLFSISQKLIQHQIYNYTEILKWLREILICRNNFLQKHKDYAYVGSNIRICRQAHIKLEVRNIFTFEPKFKNVCKQDRS